MPDIDYEYYFIHHVSLLFSEDSLNTVQTSSSPDKASCSQNNDESQVSIIFRYYL